VKNGAENKAALRRLSLEIGVEIFGVADIAPVRGEFLLQES